MISLKRIKEGHKEGREEERRARLQAQRILLLITVQSLFPKLTSLAEEQVHQIKDATIVEGVIAAVVSARTAKAARRALLSWNQTKQND